MVSKNWPKDLKRPDHPPGRDVQCIVSVGMLTEGWDCNTVTHIIGLRPFMSQLLCEQVVGRGLRRTNYEVGSDGMLTEETATGIWCSFRGYSVQSFSEGSTATTGQALSRSCPSCEIVL